MLQGRSGVRRGKRRGRARRRGSPIAWLEFGGGLGGRKGTKGVRSACEWLGGWNAASV